MPTPKIKLPNLVCLRGGYGSGEKKWIPRVKHPQRCPECNSPYWDKPYKSKAAEERRIKRAEKEKKED